MTNEVHYYTKTDAEPMHRISKEEAEKIENFNRSLPFERWNEIQFIFRVKVVDV